MLIYKITNLLNGKSYIGQTTKPLKERMRKHYTTTNVLIDKEIARCGINNFTVDVIDKAENRDELNQKEIYWIAKYNTLIPNGYNQCYGGATTKGYRHTLATKNKMSQLKQGMYLGKDNPFFGKHHSAEQIEKWKKERSNSNIYKMNAKKANLVSALVNKRPVLNKTTGEKFDSVSSAAEKYGLKNTHISRVCRGKRKKTGGFEWEYLN